MPSIYQIVSDKGKCNSKLRQRINIMESRMEKTIDKHYEILKFFKYEHLPEHLREASRPFCELAEKIAYDSNFKDGAEKSVALRKLLEAKDAAVRCAL